MNPEFQKRQNQVFDILEKLSVQARKEKKALVFIGGSAVHATLPKPVRLSIDLDAYYSGDSARLLECLRPEFEVGKRASRDEQFEFFEARKDGVLVKIDLAKFSVSKSQFGQKMLKSSRGKFRASIAVPEYLLAAKLSALAVGTIGRRQERKDFQIDFLKDVTDASNLIEFVKPGPGIWEHMEAIIRAENRLRKTSYGFGKVMESTWKTVLESIQAGDSDIVSKGTLQNFTQYLFGKPVRKPDYWQMAGQVAAYVGIGKTAKPSQFPEAWKKANNHVQKEYADPRKASEWQARLLGRAADRNLLHELKTLSPKALGYYYYARFAE